MAHLPFSNLTGNLYKASVEAFTYGEGKTGVRFKLITQRKWKDKDGNKQEGKPFFHKCSAFGKNAEIIQAAKEGGFIISFEPEFITDEYEKDGVKKYATKIVARFVKAWKWNEEQSTWEEQELVGADAPSAAEEGDQDLPF
jgi:single-stranded DNA-binding protein